MDGFALASVVPGDQPRLVVCDERSGGDPGRALQLAVRQHGLEGSRCVWVLPEGAYSLRLIDAPEVPPDEIREAARWIVKDLIDFDADSAVIDVLEMPQTTSPGRPRKIYVAAARPDAVRHAAQWARDASLDLAAVAVPESVMLNVAPPTEGPRSVAVLQLRGKGGLLVVGEGGCPYAARHLSVSLEQLEAEVGESFEEIEDGTEPPPALENLLLEIQRSLDYYDSAFGRSPVGRLLVAPAEVEVPALLPYLTRNLSVGVHLLDASDRLAVQGTLPHVLQARCLTAVGAALEAPDAPSIDLRSSALLPVQPPLSARRLAQAAGVVVLLLASVGIWAGWQTARARSDLAVLDARRQALEARVTELTRTHAARPVDTALEARVGSLTRERESKARLLESLDHHAQADARRFPGALEGLARRPVPGLWLREVHVTDAGRAVALVGSSLQADLVPRLLQELEVEWAFEGTGFRKLELTRDAKDAARIDFELSTRSEESVE